FYLPVFLLHFFFFFQAEDGIRDFHVTGVQTCALPISAPNFVVSNFERGLLRRRGRRRSFRTSFRRPLYRPSFPAARRRWARRRQIGRASCRERVKILERDSLFKKTK